MNKGCFNKLVFLFVVIFTGLIILSAGLYAGYLYLADEIKTQSTITSDQLKEKSDKVADFSKIPYAYSVTNAYDFHGAKLVLAKYQFTEQVMGVMQPAWIIGSEKGEITIDQLEKKVTDIVGIIKKQNKLKIDNFIIIKKDKFRAQNQTIPYLKIALSFSGVHKGNYLCIIGLIKNTKTNKTDIILSYNEPSKFRHSTYEKFFRRIKF